MFGGIESGRIDADDAGVTGEGRPGAGGKILQPCSNGQNGVRLARQGVCGVGSGHTHRSAVERIGMQEIGSPRNRLDDRDCVTVGEFSQFIHCAGILHTAAGNDQRSFRRLQQCNGFDDFGLIGRLPANPVRALLEEFQRIVEGPPLHVLRKAEKGPDRNRPDRAWSR